VTATARPRRTQEGGPNWKQIVARYQTPDVRRSVGQILTSIVPYFALLALMYFSLSISYWLVLLLAIPAAGFFARIFIIFHDCGHGSFFKNRRANDLLGAFTGLLTVTPYYRWRHAHAVHHATAGDLDRREAGDIWTMTVYEYLRSSPLKRLGYRIYRNPLLIFTVGAWMLFFVFQRFPISERTRRQIMSILWTDLALAIVLVVAWLTIGIGPFLLVVLPAMLLGTSAGVWLFYVQHQFEGVYWERHENWDYAKAALQGSSFYKLPRLLQWFSGNIGFHHIHHLSPRIPNYKLEQAYNENELFHVKPITLRTSLKSLTFRLWDEEHRQLVGFDYVKQLAKVAPAAVVEAPPVP
jgi:omega-6 fatty acid desaturase (delta-12 desaturase)